MESGQYIQPNPSGHLKMLEIVDEKDHFQGLSPQIGRLMTNSIFTQKSGMDYIINDFTSYAGNWAQAVQNVLGSYNHDWQ